MPIQGYTPNKNLVKIAQNSTDSWDVWSNQNLDTLDEPALVYNIAAAENLNAGDVAVIKDDGTGAKKAHLATVASYAAGDPLGIALASVTAGSSVRLSLDGRVQNAGWSFGPPDKFVYLSGAGTVTTAQTATKIGFVLSSTAIYFTLQAPPGGQTDSVTGANGIQNTGNNVNAVLSPVYGSMANTICQGNDARLHAQNTDGGTSAASFEINYTANSARILTTGLTANRDYTLPDGATKLLGESVPSVITAQHSFSPAVAQAPFALGANAQGQLVTGLNADKLDGSDASTFATSAHNHDAAYAPISRGEANSPVVNGAMNVWQRGTSFTADGYTADRWHGDASGSANFAFSQQVSAQSGFRYSMRAARNSGQTWTSTMRLSQAFETVNSFHLQGKTVTLSFYARAGGNYSAASGYLVSRVITGTGTDQSNAAMLAGTWTGYSATDQNNVLTTTFQRFTQTLTLGSGVTQVGIQFRFAPVGTAGADDWFEIAGVQIEAGSSATDYNHRPYQQELAICQRYYEVLNMISGGTYLGGGFIQSANVARFTMPCVQKRAAPTLTYSGPLEIMYASGTTTPVTGVADVRAGSNFTSFYLIPTGTPLTPGQACALYANGGAATISFLSEL